ncbi:MAG: HD domain-containing protein [Oscillospiraceae bacterium]|nr:HD domain-containing protein [Oscillospiraceae bacterium]
MAKKQIRDIIYGFIELDEQELEIINHPVFQRLRRIRQLAFTDMLYPGACHTRFEHSLGVMQMATYMYDHIVDKHGKALEDFLHINNTGVDFALEKEKARKIIRLAALLHDVGHAPFSHSGEELMPYHDESKNTRYKHEDYSIKAIEEYFSDIIKSDTTTNLKISVDDVTSLLGKKGVRGAGGLHFSLKEIISSQLDADRADYLLRDSAHIGVDYGKYDMWRLINSVTLAKGEGGTLVFAIAYKGLQVAESLIIARYHMFHQVYYHKVRRIYDYHAGEALKEVLPLIGHKDATFPPPTQIADYMELDDWTVLGAINSNSDAKHCGILQNRLHYKLEDETNDPPTHDDIKRFTRYEDNYKDKEHHIYRIGEIYKGDKKASLWYKPYGIHILEGNGALVELESKSALVQSLIREPQKLALYLPRPEEENRGQG